MTFRVLLAVGATVLLATGARAQGPDTSTHRVVVHIDGKPTSVVRAELWRASRAVCRSEHDTPVVAGEDCTSATFDAALERLKAARSASLAASKPTTVASR